MTEAEIIKILTTGCSQAPGRNAVGDDAAQVISGAAVSTDAMLEGVHFDERLTPQDIGWKIIAVNASDIAAMGQKPDWVTLAAALPQHITTKWLEEFSSGMRLALNNWDISLVGGDVVRSPGPIMLSLTIGGRPSRSVVWRSQALVGDAIWVTGNLGGAAAGFHHPENEIGMHHLRRPEPPIDFAVSLAKTGVIHSMIDLSDGLHKDLINICTASQVGAIIDPEKLPKGPALSHIENPLPYQVAFGEDYQFLFTTLDSMDPVIRQIARRHRLRVSKIGEIVSRDIAGGPVMLRNTAWPEPQFQHFSSVRNP